MAMTRFPLNAASVAYLVLALGSGNQPTDGMQLSLTRQYGRALYRDCRVDVVVFERQGRTQLHCTWNTEPPKPLFAQRALSAQEVQELSKLASASELCSGGHLGQDGRSGDGVLETLLTTCREGQVAVLVTSGNPTFKASGARRQLLDRLDALEAELRKSTSSLK